MSIEENGAPADIVEFAERFLGIKLFESQKAILRLMARPMPSAGTVYVSGVRCGKHQLADILQAYWAAMIGKNEGVADGNDIAR